MEKINCVRCKKEVDPIIRLKFFRTNYLNERYPKWNFQVQAICPLCNIWIKHLEQTDELMAEIKYWQQKIKDDNSQQTLI